VELRAKPKVLRATDIEAVLGEDERGYRGERS